MATRGPRREILHLAEDHWAMRWSASHPGPASVVFLNHRIQTCSLVSVMEASAPAGIGERRFIHQVVKRHGVDAGEPEEVVVESVLFGAVTFSVAPYRAQLGPGGRLCLNGSPASRCLALAESMEKPGILQYCMYVKLPREPCFKYCSVPHPKSTVTYTPWPERVKNVCPTPGSPGLGKRRKFRLPSVHDHRLKFCILRASNLCFPESLTQLRRAESVIATSLSTSSEHAPPLGSQRLERKGSNLPLRHCPAPSCDPSTHLPHRNESCQYYIRSVFRAKPQLTKYL